MILKFNKNRELEIIGIGIFGHGEIIVTEDPLKAKKYLDSGYFDIVIEKKKPKKERKKSKKIFKKIIEKNA